MVVIASVATRTDAQSRQHERLKALAWTGTGFLQRDAQHMHGCPRHAADRILASEVISTASKLFIHLPTQFVSLR